MTDDIARTWTTQPKHNRGDLLGPSGAPDRHAPGDIAVGLLVPVDHVTGDLCIDESWIGRVHVNAVLAIFQSGRARQAPTPCLDAMYEPIPGFPVNAPTDALLTMTPALLNAASSRPNSSTVRATIASTCESSPTS